MPESLIFTSSPSVTIATNTFVDVPIILRYDGVPLIEMVQEVDASFTTKIDIWDDSGTKLAVARGTQLYATTEGERAGVTLLHPQGLTVCQLGDRTIFEIRREGAAAAKLEAELFAADGRFITAPFDGMLGLLEAGPGSLQLLGATLRNNHFQGLSVGIDIRSDGTLSIGGMPQQ